MIQYTIQRAMMQLGYHHAAYDFINRWAAYTHREHTIIAKAWLDKLGAAA